MEKPDQKLIFMEDGSIMEKLNRELLSIKDGSTIDCEITVHTNYSTPCILHIDFFANLTFESHAIFTCLVKIEYELEKHGYILLCNISRKDTHPNGMLGDASRGRRAFVWSYVGDAEGPSGRSFIVDLLDPIEPDLAVSIHEHAENFKDWGLYSQLTKLKNEDQIITDSHI
jgi:hypothetical protein